MAEPDSTQRPFPFLCYVEQALCSFSFQIMQPLGILHQQFPLSSLPISNLTSLSFLFHTTASQIFIKQNCVIIFLNETFKICHKVQPPPFFMDSLFSGLCHLFQTHLLFLHIVDSSHLELVSIINTEAISHFSAKTFSVSTLPNRSLFQAVTIPGTFLSYSVLIITLYGEIHKTIYSLHCIQTAEMFTFL